MFLAQPKLVGASHDTPPECTELQHAGDVINRKQGEKSIPNVAQHQGLLRHSVRISDNIMQHCAECYNRNVLIALHLPTRAHYAPRWPACSIVMPPRFSSLLHHEHDAHVFLFAPYAEFSRNILRYPLRNFGHGEWETYQPALCGFTVIASETHLVFSISCERGLG